MTLEELIDLHRPCLLDESVGVQRSWEDTFKYALKVFPGHTPLEEFDLDLLARKLSAMGINPAFVDGYVKRWRHLIAQSGSLIDAQNMGRPPRS